MTETKISFKIDQYIIGYNPNKWYAVFSKDEFYLYDNDKLNPLTKHEPITLPDMDLLSLINPNGSHVIVECDTIDIALDLFNNKEYIKFFESL